MDCIITTATVLSPPAVIAHSGHFEGSWAPGTWNLHPLVIVPLLLTAALYARGLSVIQHSKAAPTFRRKGALFFGGLFVLAIALVSPLEHLSETWVSAHMVQHLLLIQIAAPLLVLGSPLVVALVAVKSAPSLLRGLRRTVGSRHLSLAATPLAVLLFHAVALLSWHLPALYNAALASEAMHISQHVAFLATGVLFWQIALPSLNRHSNLGATVGLLFVMTVISGGLGALLTLSPTPWYAYEGTTQLSALEDQQIAGAIMWVIGAMLYAVAAGWVFVSWMNVLEQRAEMHRAGQVSSGQRISLVKGVESS